MNRATLLINEIFHSIQGESTWAGLPCLFVRLTGCSLRCVYCDTEYAFHEGKRMTIEEIIGEMERLSGKTRLVEVTGGEPLMQDGVHALMTALCDRGYTVLLETSGAYDISGCDARVHRIVDFKTPDSTQSGRNLMGNVKYLTQRDEVKFVLMSEGDYAWARGVIVEHDLTGKVGAVLMSAVHRMAGGKELAGCAGLGMAELAGWILRDGLKVRMQTQLHKLIWDGVARGV